MTIQRFWRAVAFSSLILCSSTLWADQAANQQVKANALEGGLGQALDGSGIKIGVVEALPGGLPQLGDSVPANPNMPNTGPAGGQDGKITLVPNPYIPVGMVPAIGDHATMVNGVIMGTGNGVSAGIAPQAQVFTAPAPTEPSQIQVSQDMLRSDMGPNVSIMNYSLTYNGGGNRGNDLDSLWQDWAALTNNAFLMHNKLFVTAGNETPAGRTDPFDNYNGITVGATTGPNGVFLANYNRTNVTADGRFKTDIVAPGGGTSIVNVAGGGGTATMQSPVMVGSAPDNAAAVGKNDGINSDPQFAGTSFAAPLVSGAAAILLQEAGGNMDHTALKALLLNGASKKVGNTAANDWHAFGANGTKGPGGATAVNIGWDQNLGTGLLDVTQSLTNLDAGQQAPGAVNPVGWDYEAAKMTAAGSVADYLIQNLVKGFTSITASLAWDRRPQLVKGVGNTNLQLWQPAGAGPGATADTFTMPGLNDLDLKLFDVTTGNTLLYQSDSALDSIEHINFDVPAMFAKDQFDIQVKYFAINDAVVPITPYGLAWSTTVPEPMSFGFLMLGGITLLRIRRKAA